MRIWTLAALALALTACKAPTEAEASNSAPSPVSAFEQASAQYLIDTKAVQSDCAELLGADIVVALNKPTPSRKVCGKMTLGLDATRQLIDIAHGGNQVAPWESGAFTSGIFAIEDNVVMTVLLFPREEVIVLGEQPTK